MSNIKRILITGASGFVGRALCQALLKNGHLIKGTFHSNEISPAISGKMECINVGDIDEHTDWNSALRNIDTVIHLASRVHKEAESYATSLSENKRINTEGTRRLATMAAKCNIRRFIFLSSIKVNGQITGRNPFTEESLPAPQDSYALSKWEAERILKRIGSETGLEVVVIRPPLVYGPGVKANFFRLMKFVEKGIPIPLGNINNKRSLIFLGNLVDAIVSCMNHPKAAGETLLVSDGKDVSTYELIKIIAAAMDKRSFILPCPPRLIKYIGRLTGCSEEISRLTDSLVVDSSRIQSTLDWIQPYTLEEGMRETVKWYRSL